VSIGGSDGIDGSKGGSVESTLVIEVSIAGRDLSMGGREVSTDENVKSETEVLVGASGVSVDSAVSFGGSPGGFAGSAVSAISLVW
jgi:hypothetical protein